MKISSLSQPKYKSEKEGNISIYNTNNDFSKSNIFTDANKCNINCNKYFTESNDNDNNTQKSICDLIDVISDNNLNIFYNDKDNKESNFKNNIDQLNLKFYLQTEKILNNNQDIDQTENQNTLFLILFKQISLYIKEVERLNTIILQQSKDPQSIKKRMAIISQQKDNFETKEQMIQTLKNTNNILEKKFAQLIISENKIRQENENLKKEIISLKNKINNSNKINDDINCSHSDNEGGMKNSSSQVNNKTILSNSNGCNNSTNQFSFSQSQSTLKRKSKRTMSDNVGALNQYIKLDKINNFYITSYENIQNDKGNNNKNNTLAGKKINKSSIKNNSKNIISFVKNNCNNLHHLNNNSINNNCNIANSNNANINVNNKPISNDFTKNKIINNSNNLIMNNSSLNKKTQSSNKLKIIKQIKSKISSSTKKNSKKNLCINNINLVNSANNNNNNNNNNSNINIPNLNINIPVSTKYCININSANPTNGNSSKITETSNNNLKSEKYLANSSNIISNKNFLETNSFLSESQNMSISTIPKGNANNNNNNNNKVNSPRISCYHIKNKYSNYSSKKLITKKNNNKNIISNSKKSINNLYESISNNNNSPSKLNFSNFNDKLQKKLSTNNENFIDFSNSSFKDNLKEDISNEKTDKNENEKIEFDYQELNDIEILLSDLKEYFNNMIKISSNNSNNKENIINNNDNFIFNTFTPKKNISIDLNNCENNSNFDLLYSRNGKYESNNNMKEEYTPHFKLNLYVKNVIDDSIKKKLKDNQDNL